MHTKLARIMIELPEAAVIANQAKNTLTNKTITELHNATYNHKFTFFNGDPLKYKDLLVGRRIVGAQAKGMFIDICIEDNIYLSLYDGVNFKYGTQNADIPQKHQLLLGFDDETFLAFTVAMYGGIAAFRGSLNNMYRKMSVNSISPLTDDFDENYFDRFISTQKKTLSAKALLATEQRIPGLGNGALQDILFNARVNPKRKISTLSDTDKTNLFISLKSTLAQMYEQGGRDTATDFFGNNGDYKTILSRNTINLPCPSCGTAIVKEPYLGGSVYYCPECQKLQ